MVELWWLRPFFPSFSFICCFFYFYSLLCLFFYSSIFRALECVSVCMRALKFALAHASFATIKAMNLFIQPLKTLFSVFLKKKNIKNKDISVLFCECLRGTKNTHSLTYSFITTLWLLCCMLRWLLFVFHTLHVLLNLRELTVFYNVIFICC